MVLVFRNKERSPKRKFLGCVLPAEIQGSFAQTSWVKTSVRALETVEKQARRCGDRRERSGSEQGVFWKRGLFRKVHFLEILETLRAKGTLISEPRFSTPCEMRFFPREKGETAFFKEKSSTEAVFPFSRGKNRVSRGVENRGSLISVPLALRGI